jgi:hypothetical protein
LRPGRGELLSRDAVWEELGRRGATLATVAFSGRAGQGGSVGTIRLRHGNGEGLGDVELPTERDELADALEGPVWDRYGSFTGHPPVRGTVIWTLADRAIRISGERAGEPFEEVIR